MEHTARFELASLLVCNQLRSLSATCAFKLVGLEGLEPPTLTSDTFEACSLSIRIRPVSTMKCFRFKPCGSGIPITLCGSRDSYVLIWRKMWDSNPRALADAFLSREAVLSSLAIFQFLGWPVGADPTLPTSQVGRQNRYLTATIGTVTSTACSFYSHSRMLSFRDPGCIWDYFYVP